MKRKDFLNSNGWKLFMAVVEGLAIVAAAGLILWGLQQLGIVKAEADEFETAYAICVPGDQVNVRSKPSTKSSLEGWLEPGDKVYLDGKKKHGFAHCVNMSNEAGEGWVHAGYLVSDKPTYLNRSATIISKGRLAARKYVDGKRTRWLKPLASVKVYYWSDEWCCTNCGYVQTKYLELEGDDGA